MQPRALRPNPSLRTAYTYQPARVPGDDFYVRCTLWKRCHCVPTGSSNCRSLSTSTFLADWFEEKCRANFEVTFSAPANETGVEAGRRGARFWCQKNTQRPWVVRISTNIIRCKGWRAVRPCKRLSRCVIRISAKSLTRTRWQPDNKSLLVTHVLDGKDVVMCEGPSFLISTKIPAAKYICLA